MSNLNELLNAGREYKEHRYNSSTGGMRSFAHAQNKRIHCNDGYNVSIQCQETSYCSPRTTFETVELYNSFELGFPSSHDSILDEYRDNDIYAYVPREVVEQLLELHGGADLHKQDMYRLIQR